MKLIKKEWLSESFDKHDLEIEDNHSFVVEGVVVHNSNCRVGVIDGKPVAGSMEVRRKRPTRAVVGDPTGAIVMDCELDSDEVKRNTYWFPFSILGVYALLNDMKPYKSAILYGEVYGGSIQSLDYGIPKGKGLGFRAFGLRLGDKFVDWDEFAEICKRYGVETVPVLWRGPFSLAKAKELADGKSSISGHIREGTVAYPVKERENAKIGRAILKFIGTEYELSKHLDMDVKDV
jgi:hypothetical protein